MMGTYSNTDHMIPEANGGTSAPRFGWFYPGSFYSAPKSSPVHSQGTQIGTQQGLSVAPIRSFVPAAEPVKDSDSGTKTSKAKKPKPSVKGGCNQIPPKTMKSKKPKKTSSRKETQSMPEAKREKRSLDVDIEKMNFDLSGVPSPFCSCTGIARVCYKWGAGGWQSSCCTTSISEHPLPMSPTRPGARLAGRKMSNGAYLKLLLKLATEGYDLSHPVDLKHHWARHGTNKFVTIK